ncbi:MAG: hypothetical protein M1833_005805 [Piccolia ochrophora]|nr:MAG: hypothetical protein M1833_005805 [Piccolia ochrophora]
MDMNNSGRARDSVLPLHERRKASKKTDEHRPNRIPYLDWVPNAVRNHFIAMAGEFTGTFLFLFFALSATQVANSAPSDPPGAPNPSILLYISLAFGFSLGVNVWVFFRISGGLFNPAVTFGMWLVGALPGVRAVLLFISEIIGGICAAAVVECLFPGPLAALTFLAGGVSIPRGLFIEMFLTAELVFTIFMLAAEKHRATFIAPVGIGLSLFIAELSGVYYTGGSLNPARSFGPAVAARKFDGYHWIYWLGPFLGALIASGFYKFIKMLEYETANPGQDEDDERKVPDPEGSPEHAKFPRDYDPEGRPRPGSNISEMTGGQQVGRSPRRSNEIEPSTKRHSSSAR